MVVLLVEDDTALRNLAAFYLQEEQFYVLQARDGAEALHIARTHSRIDLLLTDVEMGDGFNGIELASRLLTERPSLPALIMSGLPDSERAAAQNGFLFLAKPFTTSHLRQRVRECLASTIRVQGESATVTRKPSGDLQRAHGQASKG